MSEFKAQNAAKYSNKFTAEPAARPTYIPQSYQGAPVTYNAGMGGYGFTNSLGQFMLYDALTDLAASHYTSYLVSNRPAVVTTTPAHVSGGPSFGGLFLVLGIIVLIVGGWVLYLKIYG